MQATTRLYLTELLGTFLVVLFGAGTVCASHLNLAATEATTGLPRGLDVTGIALAEGLILGALLATLGPLGSAGFNPAIAVALYVRKTLDLGTTGLLIALQLIGAVLAGLVVYLLFSREVLEAASVGTPHLFAFRGFGSPGTAFAGAEGTGGTGYEVWVTSLTSGVLLEFLFTAVLSFVFFWWMLDPKSPPLGGVLVGLVMVAIVVFGFRLTGGAANPARWFGPAVWEAMLGDGKRAFSDNAVYWAGPIGGAVVGSLLAGWWGPKPGAGR